MFQKLSIMVIVTAIMSIGSYAFAANCPVKLGVVLPVSGPMGQVGERIANTGQFAVDQFNEAGGIQGCNG